MIAGIRVAVVGRDDRIEDLFKRHTLLLANNTVKMNESELHVMEASEVVREVELKATTTD